MKQNKKASSSNYDIEYAQEYEIPYILTLKKPIEYGNKTITELVFEREPMAADLKGMTMNDMSWDNLMQLGSRVLGLPPSLIGKLSPKDLQEMGAVIMSFF